MFIAINNSYQIAEEFRFPKRKLVYHPPLPRKMQRVTAPVESPGPCKVYTKEEIFLFQCQRAAKALGWK